MKVAGLLGLSPLSSSSGLTKPPSGSFAEVLASGRTVQSIRSERAFGFSETGLLGASRVSSAEKQNGGQPAAPLVRRDTAHVLSRSTATDRANARQAVGGKPVGTNRSAAPSLRAGADLSATASKFAASLGLHEQIKTNAQELRAMKLQPGSLTNRVNGPFQREKQRRGISVSGSDEAICVTIHAFDVQSWEEGRLFTTFVLTAQQFGMTLGSVRLNNKD